MANWKKIGWITGIATASTAGLFYVARGFFNKAYDINELKKLNYADLSGMGLNRGPSHDTCGG